jgi:hypothetical protein
VVVYSALVVLSPTTLRRSIAILFLALIGACLTQTNVYASPSELMYEMLINNVSNSNGSYHIEFDEKNQMINVTVRDYGYPAPQEDRKQAPPP